MAIKLTSLKLSYDGEIRRLPTSPDLTYKGLLAKTLSVFPLLSSLQFSWVDDEGDRVVISSDEELWEALRFVASEEMTCLRFEVLAHRPLAGAGAGTNVAPSSQSARFTITHAGVKCCECGVSSITGARFKCSVRDNHDLCEACEEAVPRRAYPALKIYHPAQLPVGMSVFFEENRRPKGKAGCHRGVCCDGCGAKNFQGARFKCTVRKDFDLCQRCECEDPHPHMMVKMYPHHSHLTLHVSPTGPVSSSIELLPVAPSHFRHSGAGDDHADAKENCGRKGRGYWRKHGASKGRGRHCWDRRSIAQAAALRAKAKLDEQSSLEDQLLDMCIKESLLEAERMAVSTPESSSASSEKNKSGGHCWDRSSVTKAAAMRAVRRSHGCHNWAHVATAVDAKPPHQTSFLRKGQGRHNWDHPSADKAALKLKLKHTKQRKIVIAEMEGMQEAKEDAHLQASLLAMMCAEGKEKKQVGDSAALKCSAAPSSALAAVMGGAPPQKKTARPCSDTIASAFKQGVLCEIAAAAGHSARDSASQTRQSPLSIARARPPSGPVLWKTAVANNSCVRKRESIMWVIPDNKKAAVEKAVTSEPETEKEAQPEQEAQPETDRIFKLKALADQNLTVAGVEVKNCDIVSRSITPPPTTPEEKEPPIAHSEQPEQLDEQKQRMQFDHDLCLWGHELEVLCDMGFSDVEELLPLLKMHVGTPASAREPGANLSEEGLGAIVLEMLMR